LAIDLAAAGNLTGGSLARIENGHEPDQNEEEAWKQ
jgi:hypothetical protein